MTNYDLNSSKETVLEILPIVEDQWMILSQANVFVEFYYLARVKSIIQYIQALQKEFRRITNLQTFNTLRKRHDYQREST